jgi:hypothetical protein
MCSEMRTDRLPDDFITHEMLDIGSENVIIKIRNLALNHLKKYSDSRYDFIKGFFECIAQFNKLRGL